MQTVLCQHYNYFYLGNHDENLNALANSLVGVPKTFSPISNLSETQSSVSDSKVSALAQIPQLQKYSDSCRYLRTSDYYTSDLLSRENS